MKAIELAIVEKLGRADLYWRAHKRARFIWSRTSNLLLASIAVAGALSGGSVLGDKTTAAVVLGLTTALLSGFNVGVQPAERSAEHRSASAGYGSAFRTLQRLLSERSSDEAGDQAVLHALREVDAQFDRLDREAPSVKPRRRERFASKSRVTFVLTGTTGEANHVATRTVRSRLLRRSYQDPDLSADVW